MKEIKTKSVVPVYVTGLVWLLYAFLFPVYRISDLIIVTIISAAAYFLFSKIIPGKAVMQPDASVFKKTGDNEKDALLSCGREYMRKINALLPYADEGSMKTHIAGLAERGGRIFEFVSKNPADIRQTRRFIDYYCPAAIKLAESHAEFRAHPAGSEKVKEAADNINNAMQTIITAFDKHLEMLYENKVIDVNTDIEVLKGMLRAAGLDGPDNKGGDGR